MPERPGITTLSRSTDRRGHKSRVTRSTTAPSSTPSRSAASGTGSTTTRSGRSDGWLFPQVSGLAGIWATDVGNVANLAKDLQGNYPYAYTFIEPSYGDVMHNTYAGGSSQHPRDGMHNGEALIKRVYEAIRNSPHWNTSVLIVTYDEHGGFYDSVIPPRNVPAPARQKKSPPDQSGCDFRQLGVRVPAVVVSPWIPKGTVDHTQYDHTSVLRTIENLFGISSLTARDAAANDVLALLSVPAVRTDCMTTLPDPVPDTPPAAPLVAAMAPAPAADEPLPQTGNIHGFIALAAKAHLEMAEGDPVATDAIHQTLTGHPDLGQARAICTPYRPRRSLTAQERVRAHTGAHSVEDRVARRRRRRSPTTSGHDDGTGPCSSAAVVVDSTMPLASVPRPQAPTTSSEPGTTAQRALAIVGINTRPGPSALQRAAAPSESTHYQTLAGSSSAAPRTGRPRSAGPGRTEVLTNARRIELEPTKNGMDGLKPGCVPENPALGLQSLAPPAQVGACLRSSSMRWRSVAWNATCCPLRWSAPPVTMNSSLSRPGWVTSAPSSRSCRRGLWSAWRSRQARAGGERQLPRRWFQTAQLEREAATESAACPSCDADGWLLHGPYRSTDELPRWKPDRLRQCRRNEQRPSNPRTGSGQRPRRRAPNGDAERHLAGPAAHATSAKRQCPVSDQAGPERNRPPRRRTLVVVVVTHQRSSSVMSFAGGPPSRLATAPRPATSAPKIRLSPGRQCQPSTDSSLGRRTIRVSEHPGGLLDRDVTPAGGAVGATPWRSTYGRWSTYFSPSRSGQWQQSMFPRGCIG